MNRLLSCCLAFAGFCQLGGAILAAADWGVCLANGGGVACRTARADATAAFANAASAALGVAFQRRGNDREG